MVIWMKKFICISYMEFRFREKRKWCVSSKRAYIAWNKLQDNDIRSSITSWAVMVFWGVRHIIVVISRGLMIRVLLYYYMLMICWITRASIHESPWIEQEWVYMAKVPYASIIGNLMYVMICSRSNIVHVVGLWVDIC